MLFDELIIDNPLSPLLELSPTSNTNLSDIAPHRTGAITFLSPGDGDSFDDEEQDDWSDVDDEDFEDMAEDENDLHQIELENDILDPDDDDHLPPEEDF
ncbi:MAG: hypothetical protein JWR02_2732 [Mucilaginibacter sp.]|nr:hypothetical protein [Mucilaginibacter sp.]